MKTSILLKNLERNLIFNLTLDRRKKMVKSLLQLCLDIANKPYRETDLSKYWLNYGYQCIPFKFGQKIRYQEFWFCTKKNVERKKYIVLLLELKTIFIVALCF